MTHENDPNDPKNPQPNEEPEQAADAISDEQLDQSAGAGFSYGEVDYSGT